MPTAIDSGAPPEDCVTQGGQEFSELFSLLRAVAYPEPDSNILPFSEGSLWEFRTLLAEAGDQLIDGRILRFLPNEGSESREMKIEEYVKELCDAVRLEYEDHVAISGSAPSALAALDALNARMTIYQDSADEHVRELVQGRPAGEDVRSDGHPEPQQAPRQHGRKDL